MAGPKIFDRVKDTTTTTGTGTVTLVNSAPTAFRTFGSVLSNGDTVPYAIIHQTANEWEVGVGTYDTSGTTLARTTVRASSNSGAAVNFSSGTKDVFLPFPADFPQDFLHPTNTVANLAAFQAGRVLFPSNGFQIYRDTGSSLAPWGPIFPFTLPVDGDYAWINQGDASVDTTYGGISLVAPGNASINGRVRKKSKTGSYTITLAFQSCLLFSPQRAGFCWRQSSDGKLIYFCIEINNGAGNGPYRLAVHKFTSATVFSATYTTTDGGPTISTCPTFLQVQDNGTNRICRVSSDGQTWTQVHTVGRTDFLTADEVGFFVDPAATTESALSLTLLHWLES